MLFMAGMRSNAKAFLLI